MFQKVEAMEVVYTQSSNFVANADDFTSNFQPSGE